jgi:LmbE family N-acetylglucosaminyl deacetylase
LRPERQEKPLMQMPHVQAFDDWGSPQKILVVLAHPDDPEFFCGASLARWIAAGHEVTYLLLTCGDKGTKDLALAGEELCGLRQAEQRAAAAVLGVKNVRFLGYPDGYLEPNLNLRRDITRVIRQERPHMLVTCDPTTLYFGDTHINHADHRAAGQAALDAVYPAARDHLYFPELLLEEKLEPHVVAEVWICGTLSPSLALDVTNTWEIKILALKEHKSQIGDPQAMVERMLARRTPGSTAQMPRYQETFRRIKLA